jgi:autotransporter-associated beta strand protein
MLHHLKPTGQSRILTVPIALLFGLPLVLIARASSAQTGQFVATPNSLATTIVPPPAANTTQFSPSSIRFGPNGQLYAWDGSSIYEQTGGYNTGAFNTIGSITSGGAATPFDSDPGPINFSQNGQNIIVSEGAGGYDSTLPAVDSNGLLFTIPIAGGTTIAPVGAVQNTFDLIPVPAGSKTTGSSPSKFFVDLGNADFTGSEVDLFNAVTGSDVPFITGIPGASSSLAISGTNWSNYTLYAGVGYGANQGQIEAFSVRALFQAVKSGTPLNWSAGVQVNPPDGNNSGSGMFVDSRGYIFTGGPYGVEVIGPSSGPYTYGIPYDTQGDLMSSASVTYNSITNQFAVQGYTFSFAPLQQTIVYSASQFGVAATNLLSWTGTNSGGGMNHSWDTTTNSTNWASNSPTVSYADGDTVIFGDTNPYNGAPVCNSQGIASVTIAPGGVQPVAVMFTNSGAANGGIDYTISGGPIGGAATLELYGNGTVGGKVTLMGPNTFTGPVVVAAGVLNVQNSAALGNSSGVSVIAGALLQLQQSTGGPVTFGLTATGSNSIPLNLYGTGLTANAGELNSISGNNSYGGAINVGSGGGQIVSSSTASGDQLTLSGGVDVATASTLAVAGPGATTITRAGLTLGNSSAIQISSGTLTISLATGTGTVSLGGGTTATVAAGATLQLAGTLSAFSDPASGNRVNIVNNGSTAIGGSLTVASGNQTVGTISGTGDTVVASAASLTADQILQNTLTIGAGATVTIRPSGSGISTTETAASDAITTADASRNEDSIGDPIAAIQAAIESGTISSTTGHALENRIAAAERLAATDPGLDASLLENRVLAAVSLSNRPSSLWSSSDPSPWIESNSELLALDSSTFASSNGADPQIANAAFAPAASFGGEPAGVPEPSTLLLAALGAFGVAIAARTRTGRAIVGG